MCGRYAASKEPAVLVEQFGVVEGPSESLAPDWNIAPTAKVYAVIDDARRPAPATPDGDAVRRLMVVRWGLVPSWAKDPSIGARMNNARLETITEKPSYKRAFVKRRCLLPADGYYEWYTPSVPDPASGGKRVKPRKQPFFIVADDDEPMAMAGLYELWRDRDVPDDDPAAWLWTVTVITTEAAAEVAGIHDRMPVVLPRSAWDDWLDPTIGSSPADQQHLLNLAHHPRVLRSWPVSVEVNNARNNGPQLVVPLALLGDDSIDGQASGADRGVDGNTSALF